MVEGMFKLLKLNESWPAEADPFVNDIVEIWKGGVRGRNHWKKQTKIINN